MMDKLPFNAADECAQRFPIKERIDTLMIEDTALINAYLSEYHYMSQMIDSLLDAKCDTLYIDKIKEKIKQIPCKPQIKYIIKTQESTAKLEVLKNDCDKKVAELSQINTKNVIEIQNLKDKNSKLLIRNIWMWVIIIALTLFSFRRQIFRL
jgi:hypothetical protein